MSVQFTGIIVLFHSFHKMPIRLIFTDNNKWIDLTLFVKIK